MPLVKLSCANCSAPLEIGDDLERFTCSYCGTAQIVERSGGVISTRKIETALKAVQRGTDRTAAELAIPRLTRELADAQQARASVLVAAREKMESAKRGRRKLALITFCVIFFLGPLLISGIQGAMGTVLALVWVVASFGVPIWVYHKVQLPKDNVHETTAALDARIAHLEEHLRANRSILDTLPV